ncbi:MAG: hypothetical protein WCJ19_01590 [bacterium]
MKISSQRKNLSALEGLNIFDRLKLSTDKFKRPIDALTKFASNSLSFVKNIKEKVENALPNNSLIFKTQFILLSLLTLNSLPNNNHELPDFPNVLGKPKFAKIELFDINGRPSYGHIIDNKGKKAFIYYDDWGVKIFVYIDEMGNKWETINGNTWSKYED